MQRCLWITEETSASTTEINDTIGDISEDATKLKTISDALEENINIFKTYSTKDLLKILFWRVYYLI